MKKIFLILLIILLSFQSAFANDSIVQQAGDNVSRISLLKPYKNVSVLVLKQMREDAKTLSETDKNIIRKYVYGAVRGENTYLLINCYLRGTLEYYVPKKEITKPLKCRLEYYANALTTSISKAKLPKNIILYRGIDAKGMKLIFKDNNINSVLNKPVNTENLAILKKNTINKTFTEKGFMSTSYDIKCIKHTNFIFKIFAPKDLQALLIEDIGKKNEKEVLINKNSEWKVTNIEIQTDSVTKKDVYMITLKYVVR